MTTTFKVSDRLFLAKEDAAKSTTASGMPMPPGTNRILVIDCSGSMTGDLPRIREQVKKKLPKLLKEKDTLSIIWFSGPGQFGVLLEAEPVATAADLATVNAAVDRWLRPVGMTGFKEPLEEVSKVVGRIGAKNKNPFSLLFLSDGCDNSWPRDQVLKACETAANGLAAATFVEYGYYADRPLLTAMAERAGGSLIFSQDFDRYEVILSDSMGKALSGSAKTEVSLPNVDVIGGFAFALHGDEILTFAVDGTKVTVPESVRDVWFLTPSAVGKADHPIVGISDHARNTPPAPAQAAALAAAYAAASLFATRMKPDIVLPLLKATGDVLIITQFNNCFGKQKYSDFMDAAKIAAFDVSKRLTKGWDPNKVPPDDAFTVLDLLTLLGSNVDNKLLLGHEKFKYSKISRARADSASNFTNEEKDEVVAIAKKETGKEWSWDDEWNFLEEVKKTNPKAANVLQARLTEIKATKVEALKFVEDDTSEGYSVTNLVYNEERPNISVQVRKNGSVDVSDRLKTAPDDVKGKIPGNFPTFIFRNYAIVKDGLVNVEVLPVKLSDATTKALNNEIASGRLTKEIIDGADAIPAGADAIILNLKTLPIINRAMVTSASAKKLFEDEWALTKARSAQKVFNTIKKEKFPRTSEGFEVLYGASASAWLKEQGFTDYSGFNPKSHQAESTDFYMAKELKISLKGFSSIPSLKDVRAGMAKGKLTPSAALCEPAVTEVDAFLASDIYKKAKKPDNLFETWLDDQQEAQQKVTRGLLASMAKTKFAIIVGQVWFNEFKSLDENTMDITVDGTKISGTVEPKESKVNI